MGLKVVFSVQIRHRSKLLFAIANYKPPSDFWDDLKGLFLANVDEIRDIFSKF